MAAVAMPRFTAEWVSLNTSNGVANWVKELPSCEIVCPAQNRLKSELRMAAVAAESSTTPRILAAVGDHPEDEDRS